MCVATYVPHAKRCAAPFHIILWVSDALDKVRLRASRELRKKGNATDAKFPKTAIYVSLHHMMEVFFMAHGIMYPWCVAGSSVFVPEHMFGNMMKEHSTALP